MLNLYDDFLPLEGDFSLNIIMYTALHKLIYMNRIKIPMAYFNN